MNVRFLALLGFKIRFAIMRVGWSNMIALALLTASATGWLCIVPHLRAQVAREHTALSHAKGLLHLADRPTPPTQRPLAEQRLAAFYDALGERQQAEQQVKTLFATASKANLALSQAEYRFASDKSGRYYTYHIQVPVKGSYAAIRQFCEQTLLAIPFASLDQISFKRDAIASRSVEARLAFTLYLAESPRPAQQSHGVTTKDSGS